MIMSLGLLSMGFQGKRATSDHMNAALVYIKDLQKRIDELSTNRDELKKLSGSNSGFDHGMSSSHESFPSSTAVVRQSLEGVEVLISTGVGDNALTLSRVIKLLLEEGLDVVRCTSTRIDGRLIHTIQSEVYMYISNHSFFYTLKRGYISRFELETTKFYYYVFIISTRRSVVI